MQMLTTKAANSMTMKITFIGPHHPCVLAPPLFFPSFFGFFFSLPERCSLFAISVSPFFYCPAGEHGTDYYTGSNCPTQAALSIAFSSSTAAKEPKAMTPPGPQKPGAFRERRAALCLGDVPARDHHTPGRDERGAAV